MLGLNNVKKYFQNLEAKLDHLLMRYERFELKLEQLERNEIKAMGSEFKTSIEYLQNNMMSSLSTSFERNFLPNSDGLSQKILIAYWQSNKEKILGYHDLLDSGFRVFSQNDEDGIILRIFSQIGTTNKQVIEIGSNCSGSALGMPENLSTNLFINHGWNGAIFELDETECSKMRYFFARHLSSKHFHVMTDGKNSYYSPQIIAGMIDARNVNSKMEELKLSLEPDFMVIDIDGDDFSVMAALTSVRPRVLVVEFEKRFRDRFSVVQKKREDFSSRWAQSGSTSLPAWEKLLASKNYVLVCVNATGFNAFFIRKDIAVNKINSVDSKIVFDQHPIYSPLPESFWLEPDEQWETFNLDSD